MQDHNAPPLNPLPWVVWALALPMIAMEVVLGLGAQGLVGGPNAIGWRLDAVERFAFSPDLLRETFVNRIHYDQLYRLVSYPLVHANFSHALFAIVILLAIGKMVGEKFYWWGMLAIFFGAAAVGAVVYTYAVPGNSAPLLGAYPPVYGLIGGFTFLLWVNLAAVGANKYRAFTMIGFLLGVQMVFGLLFGGNWDWVADFAGFTTGFALSFVVSPGGFGRVLELIRSR
jgi:membrane associated rhomboid family serine protease